MGSFFMVIYVTFRNLDKPLAVEKTPDQKCCLLEPGPCTSRDALRGQLGLCCLVPTFNFYICKCGLETKDLSLDYVLYRVDWNGAYTNAGSESQPLFLVGAFVVHRRYNICYGLENKS